MAVTVQKSAEYTKWEDAISPHLDVSDWHGRLRARYFKFTQVGAGDANSEGTLIHLPAGRVRVFGDLSTIYFDALVATSTLDIGHRAYTKIDGTAAAAVEDFFASAVASGSAGSLKLDEAGAAARAPVFESKDGVDIFFKVETAGIADADVLEGFVVYMID